MKNETLFVALLLVGCHGRGAPEAVQAAESYQRLACACQDAACAKQASAAHAAANQRNKGTEPTADETKQIVELVAKAEGCVVALGLTTVH